MLEVQIEAELHDTLGYNIPTLIRSFDEVTAVARYRPFDAGELETDSNMLRVGFLKKAPDNDAHRPPCKAYEPSSGLWRSTRDSSSLLPDPQIVPCLFPINDGVINTFDAYKHVGDRSAHRAHEDAIARGVRHRRSKRPRFPSATHSRMF